MSTIVKGQTRTLANVMTVTLSATSAADLVGPATGDGGMIDCAGLDRIAVQLSGTWVGTVTWECSNDNVTWYGVSGYTPAAPATETVATATANGLWVFRCDARYFRARCSAYTSGTINAIVSLVAIAATEIG